METQLKCRNCGAPLKPHWKMCPECDESYSQPKKCQTCGEELEERWYKCPACGEEQRVGLGAKDTRTPGAAVKDLLGKHGLDSDGLAKAINMSVPMVRLLILDESPVSVAAALRLAKFFSTEPEYWLRLQANHDLAKAAGDKKLAKELGTIKPIAPAQK